MIMITDENNHPCFMRDSNHGVSFQAITAYASNRAAAGTGSAYNKPLRIIIIMLLAD
jgi:hypothetical protein